jgi:hypothetical protein
MNVKQILTDLDKHAAEFNFPVLDNDYLDYAAARLSAFRSETDWAIVFEILSFSEREVEFVNDLYAFGSCVSRQGFIGEEIPFSSITRRPLFDPETNVFIADWSQWAMEFKGKELLFSPTLEEYRKAGITIYQNARAEQWREIDLLRFLLHTLGDDLFLSETDLLAHLPSCGMMPVFLQSRQWQHPDISSGERPSKNVSLRSLVNALSNRDPAMFEQGRPNTHWSAWSNETE